MAKKNTPVEAQAVPAGYVPALKKAYKEEIVEKLTKQFSYTTVMQVPRLVKITINEGVGDATQDKRRQLQSSLLSPVRRLSSPLQRRTFQTSSSVRECPSEPRSPFAT